MPAKFENEINACDDGWKRANASAGARHDAPEACGSVVVIVIGRYGARDWMSYVRSTAVKPCGPSRCNVICPTPSGPPAIGISAVCLWPRFSVKRRGCCAMRALAPPPTVTV